MLSEIMYCSQSVVWTVSAMREHTEHGHSASDRQTDR